MSSKARQVTKKMAETIFERDGYCIACGSPYGLDVAHYIGKGRGGLGIKENLGLLCRTCHHLYDNGNDDEVREEIKYIFKRHLKLLYPEISDEERVQKNKWDTRES